MQSESEAKNSLCPSYTIFNEICQLQAAKICRLSATIPDCKSWQISGQKLCFKIPALNKTQVITS